VEVNVEKLKELRRRKVLTLRELEAVSGVSYATVWRLESGRATDARPSTIRKLAAALGVEPEELIMVRSSDA
jgi:transcriptional regulator with XRE-family HTH domain